MSPNQADCSSTGQLHAVSWAPLVCFSCFAVFGCLFDKTWPVTTTGVSLFIPPQGLLSPSLDYPCKLPAKAAGEMQSLQRPRKVFHMQFWASGLPAMAGRLLETAAYLMPRSKLSSATWSLSISNFALERGWALVARKLNTVGHLWRGVDRQERRAI